MKTLVMVTLLAIFGSSIGARAQEPVETLISSVDEVKRTATLMVTTCAGDAAEECVSHDLTCSSYAKLSLYISGTDDAKVLAERVSSLIGNGYGNARMTASLSKGRAVVELPISEINLGQNDMNGVWDVTVSSYETQPFFDSLTIGNAEGLSFTVAGNEYRIFFADEDAAKIMQFKASCLRFAEAK